MKVFTRQSNRCLYGALVALVIVFLSWCALLRNTVTLEQLAAQVVTKTTSDKLTSVKAVIAPRKEQQNKKKRMRTKKKKKVYVLDAPPTTLLGRWDCERHYVLDGIAKSRYLERTNDPHQAEAWIYAPDTPTYASGICDGLLSKIRKSAERRRMIQRGMQRLVNTYTNPSSSSPKTTTARITPKESWDFYLLDGSDEERYFTHGLPIQVQFLLLVL